MEADDRAQLHAEPHHCYASGPDERFGDSAEEGLWCGTASSRRPGLDPVPDEDGAGVQQGEAAAEDVAHRLRAG